MINKKVIAIILILIFILAIIPSTFAKDKEYSILNSDITLVVNENGLLEVRETYTYDFNGEFHGVYRDISLKSGQSIENLTVTCENAYSTFTHEIKDGKEHITVYLYSDEAKTQPVKDTQVKVTYSYSFLKAINIYDDIGELQFKFWGNEWEVPTENTQTHVQLKSFDGVKYWINPYGLSFNDRLNNNTLDVSTKRISAGDFGEVRVLIPLNQFSDNPQFANRIHENGVAKITEIQEGYKSSAEFENSLFTIVPIILYLSLLIPIGIYYKKGREPKIEYNAIYERETPTKDSPMFVDAVFSKKRGIGTASENGYQATIMDLINRKYLILHRIGDSIELEVNKDKNFADLQSHEADIINLLKRFSPTDKINFDKLKSNLNKQSFAETFYKDYERIFSDYKEIYVKPVISNYFDEDGATLIRIYGGIMVLITLLFFYLILKAVIEPSFIVLLLTILFLIINLVLIFKLPNNVGGRWTKEGYTQYKKWQNFKKYLDDYSLISENPPESIAIWNEYLIYATALGQAKTVLKAMKKFIPEEEFTNNDLYFYHNLGGYYMMSHMINTAHSTAVASSNSGFGGIGGGSGGGGGGAF